MFLFILYLLVPIIITLAVKRNSQKNFIIGLVLYVMVIFSYSLLLLYDVSLTSVLFIIASVCLIVSLIYVAIGYSNNLLHVITCFINTVCNLIILTSGLLKEFFRIEFSEILILVFVFLIHIIFNSILLNDCEKNKYSEEEIYNGCSHMAKHFIMLFSSLGLYYFVWVFNITSDVYCFNNKKSSGILEVLLNMLVPFYNIYWYYKLSNEIELILYSKSKKNKSFSLMIILLSIFFPLAAYIILQHKLNYALTCAADEPATIATNSVSSDTAQSRSTVQENKSLTYIEEIKSLKELLDNGAITQEEFDAKKKEILGL